MRVNAGVTLSVQYSPEGPVRDRAGIESETSKLGDQRELRGRALVYLTVEPTNQPTSPDLAYVYILKGLKSQTLHNRHEYLQGCVQCTSEAEV